MDFWLCLDEEEKKKLTKPGHLSREALKNHCFSLTLGLEPMEYETYMYTVADMLKNMGLGAGHFVSVCYKPVREDRVSCIQAQRTEANGNVWIELIKELDDGMPFHTYCKNGVPTSECIDIFGKVLVDYECPELTEWDEITDIILKEKKK